MDSQSQESRSARVDGTFIVETAIWDSWSLTDRRLRRLKTDSQETNDLWSRVCIPVLAADRSRRGLGAAILTWRTSSMRAWTDVRARVGRARRTCDQAAVWGRFLGVLFEQRVAAVGLGQIGLTIPDEADRSAGVMLLNPQPVAVVDKRVDDGRRQNDFSAAILYVPGAGGDSRGRLLNLEIAGQVVAEDGDARGVDARLELVGGVVGAGSDGA